MTCRSSLSRSVLTYLKISISRSTFLILRIFKTIDMLKNACIIDFAIFQILFLYQVIVSHTWYWKTFYRNEQGLHYTAIIVFNLVFICILKMMLLTHKCHFVGISFDNTCSLKLRYWAYEYIKCYFRMIMSQMVKS